MHGNGSNFNVLKSSVNFCKEEEVIKTLLNIVKREEGGKENEDWNYCWKS